MKTFPLFHQEFETSTEVTVLKNKNAAMSVYTCIKFISVYKQWQTLTAESIGHESQHVSSSCNAYFGIKSSATSSALQHNERYVIICYVLYNLSLKIIIRCRGRSLIQTLTLVALGHFCNVWISLKHIHFWISYGLSSIHDILYQASKTPAFKVVRHAVLLCVILDFHWSLFLHFHCNLTTKVLCKARRLC